MNFFCGSRSEQFSAHESFKVLHEIGGALASAGTTKSVFAKALEVVRERLGVSRSFLVLYNHHNEKLQPFATDGLTINDFRRLENRADKSFIGEVFRSGKPVVIPRTNLEPAFAFAFETENKNSPEKNPEKNLGEKSLNEKSLVCVPILLGGRTLGALGIEFGYAVECDYNLVIQFLAAAAAMLAITIKVERQIQLEKERLQTEQQNLHRQLREKYDFAQIVGNSSAMRRVTAQVAQVARANTPVLLRGESGTGKELIANSIHYNSLRAKKAFVKFSHYALAENIIETELFGQTIKTGKKSWLEQADGGTLFLDEIADLPLPTQAKLLRLLEQREFELSGATEIRRANVRIVAATTKNLEEMIAAKTFREDLFYRLAVFTIFLPPLRERKADILQLAERFVEKYERAHNKHIKRISTPAIDMLTSYHFPGNVRELENAIERAVIVCDEHVIHGHHLPPTLQTAELTGTVGRSSLDAAVSAFERDLIADALKTTGGNCAKAAKLLDTTERIFNYKIKKYDIEPRRFRN